MTHHHVNISFRLDRVVSGDYGPGMDRKALIAEVEKYAAAKEWAPSTVLSYAGLGGQGWQRLIDGKRMFPETLQKVIDFMVTHPPDQRENR